MTGMNVKGALLGGLAAGFVIVIGESFLNVLVLGPSMSEAMKVRNVPPMGNGAIIVFLVGGFVLGLMLVHLYVAIRPRFGAGPKTALIAAFAFWFLSNFWPSLGNGLTGLIPMKLVVIGMAWGLVEACVAGLVGAALYSET